MYRSEIVHVYSLLQGQERIDEANRGDVALLDIEAIKAELAQELNETGQPK